MWTSDLEQFIHEYHIMAKRNDFIVTEPIRSKSKFEPQYSTTRLIKHFRKKYGPALKSREASPLKLVTKPQVDPTGSKPVGPVTKMEVEPE